MAKQVALPNGTLVLVAEIVAVVINMRGLLEQGQISALKELKQKSDNNGFQLSADTEKILHSRALAKSNGSVHEDIRAIVKYTLKVTEDHVEIIDLWAKPTEAPEGLQQAVDSLELDELANLVLALDLQMDPSRAIGYEKISAFFTDGKPSKTLERALFKAADERIK